MLKIIVHSKNTNKNEKKKCVILSVLGMSTVIIE